MNSPRSANRAVRPHFGQRGFTLVELMVVIVIMLMVSAVVITAFVPTTHERQVREASRNITAFFHGARDRAMQTGRPHGVMIKRLVTDDGLAMIHGAGVQLVLVEQPPNYSGDAYDSKVEVRWVLSGGNWVYAITRFPQGDSAWVNRARVGDRIQLGFHGQLYRIGQISSTAPPRNSDGTLNTAPNVTNVSSPGTTFWPLEPSVNPVVNGASGNLRVPQSAGLPTIPPEYPFDNSTLIGGVAYQIIYSPHPSGGTSYRLPANICIDMDYSGYQNGTSRRQFIGRLNVANNTTQFNPEPMIVMFGPSGGVESCWHRLVHNSNATTRTNLKLNSYFTGVSPNTGIVPNEVNGPIYLCLGRLEQANIIYEDPELRNWQDMTSLWVSINPFTGRIQSSPNAFVTDTPNGYPSEQNMSDARFFARSAQGLGGNH